MLYLASTSPRRQRLLAAAGIDFRLLPPGPEPAGDGGPAELAALRAASKAREARPDGPPGWVLGVDTVVDVDGRELGKPADLDAARRMLRTLSGRVHLVHTALCLVAHPGRAVLQARAAARVRCRKLSGAELERYLASGEWRGKAGGYGIQDAACDFMEVTAGEVDTVVGLPVAELRELLSRAAEVAP